MFWWYSLGLIFLLFTLKRHKNTFFVYPFFLQVDQQDCFFFFFLQFMMRCFNPMLACGVQGPPYLQTCRFFFKKKVDVIWLGKSSLATLHQWRRLRGYQNCISWSDKAFALVPAQQHPIINKSSRKEAFVTVYLHCFSSSPLISSSENWCALRLKQWVWQVMVSVITAQISSAGVFSPPDPPDALCVQLLQLSARLPVIQCIR